MMKNIDWIIPDWSVSPSVKALLTTRNGGCSQGNYSGSAGQGGLNLGDNTQDDPECIRQNKTILLNHLPSEPVWITQIHGNQVLRLPLDQSKQPIADAVFTIEPNIVCQIRSADCLPVLLADQQARVVGVAHAGWRGLAQGVIEALIQAIYQVVPQARLVAYLGPAIGPLAFEVGNDVHTLFVEENNIANEAFKKVINHSGQIKWLANLYLLAHQRLNRYGITQIFGGGFCTYHETERFYSYRRQPVTGRMASCIWINPISPNK